MRTGSKVSCAAMTVRPAVLRRLGYRIYRALPPRLRGCVVRWLTPNYTLGAVVLLRDPAEQLLLVRQPKARGWSLPGGLAERGERPVDTAARELAEEVNVRLEPSELTPAHPNAIFHPRAKRIDTVFTATVNPSNVNVRVDPDEILEAHWYRIDGLPPLTRTTAQLLHTYGLWAAL